MMDRPRHTLGISKLRRAELLGGTYITLIAKHEQMVKCLYQTLALAFPRMASFWNHIAAEEEQHYRLIKALEGDLRNSDISFKRPAFTQSQVHDSIGWICARKERVQHGGVSVREALAMCIQIEQGMVEHRFFDIMDEDHEKTRNVLKQLENSTVAHLQRAHKEASRFKWKLFGNKRNRPIPMEQCLKAPIDTAEAPHSAIKTAQAAILASLISLEQAAGSLYNTFAELMPDRARLWSSLSADEMSHATMLHKLEDMVEKGMVFQRMGQFGVTGIKENLDVVRNAETQAQRQGITESEAMIIALKTESYMAECEFYKTVESDAPEFKYIAERLVDLTQDHINKLRKASTPSIKEATDKREAAEKEKDKEQEVDWNHP